VGGDDRHRHRQHDGVGEEEPEDARQRAVCPPPAASGRALAAMAERDPDPERQQRDAGERREDAGDVAARRRVDGDVEHVLRAVGQRQHAEAQRDGRPHARPHAGKGHDGDGRGRQHHGRGEQMPAGGLPGLAVQERIVEAVHDGDRGREREPPRFGPDHLAGHRRTLPSAVDADLRAWTELTRRRRSARAGPG
jgi:hypothetical protein